MKRFMHVLLAALVLGALPAVAQADDLDVTLSVIDEAGDAEEQLTNDIELPDEADAEGRAGAGIDTANQARQQGSEFGRERAEEGRDQGQDSSGGNIPETPLP